MAQFKYPSGFFYNLPHENAPDFVLASISIRPDVFIEWLKEQQTNEKGYVRLQAKMGKPRNGEPARPYVEIDTYGMDRNTQPRVSGEATEDVTSDDDTIDADSIPF